jgi:hypothetical protein
MDSTLFPIGLHHDIDLTIIRLLDYQSLTTLITLDIPLHVKILIYENIDIIKENTIVNCEYNLNHYSYLLAVNLITKNNLFMFKRLDLDNNLIHDISVSRFSDDSNWDGNEKDIIYRLRHNSGNILGFLTILDEKLFEYFIENITPLGDIEIEPKNIELANSILKFFQNINLYTHIDMSKQSEIAINKIQKLSQQMHLNEIHSRLGKFLDNLYK